MRLQQLAIAAAPAQPAAVPNNSADSGELTLGNELEEPLDTPPRKSLAKRCRTADKPGATAVTTRFGRVTKIPNLEAQQSD